MSRTVRLSDLNTHLTDYLRCVRAGETLVVLDGDRVVARIEPAGAGAADDSVLAALVRAGTLRLGRPANRGDWRRSRPRVAADVVAAVLAERDAAR